MRARPVLLVLVLGALAYLALRPRRDDEDDEDEAFAEYPSREGWLVDPEEEDALEELAAAEERTPVAHGAAHPVEIGAFVRDLRASHGWSQAELARRAGVGRRFLIELESGKPTVRLDAARRVVRLFGREIGIVDAPAEG